MEKYFTQHHSTLPTMSQKHGHTNTYCLKASNGNFRSKVSHLIPRGVCQKMGGKKCFFHLLNDDVFATNIHVNNYDELFS